MNNQASTSNQNDMEQSSSPKRKKIRQKYAPKACVSCRRSKLKCSGHNPCQRCRDNGKRCFFSEDQTAAEALQNLSRPSIPQQPSNNTPNSNGSDLTLCGLGPTQRNSERAASDAGAVGLSMEARMARIEAMMETLLQERSLYSMSSASAGRDDSGGDLPMPMSISDPINPALSFLDQSPHVVHPQDAIDPLLDTETTSIRVGSQSFVFPAPATYQNYIDNFFRETQLFHPCIDEHLFRARSAKMLSGADIHPDNACFLALNYVVFALRVVLTEIVPPESDHKLPGLPGWHWLLLADDVIGKRQLYGQGDISLAQFLLFKAIYYTLVDQPSLAYNTIGLASRFALQQGLNRQASLSGAGAWESFERLRVFWSILIVDRRISLSCGRPYTIRDSDIDVERPRDLFQRDIISNPQFSQQHTHFNEVDEEGAFLSCMIDWSRFAGSLWDSLLASYMSADVLAERVTTFDAAVADFLDNTFRESQTEFQPPQLHSYICMSFDNLRLLARRTMATSLSLNRATVDCSRIAVDTVAHVQAFEAAAKYPLTCSLRHHMIPSLAGSLLLLCSMLVSDLNELGLPLDSWLPSVHQTFDMAVALLHGLAQEISLARRVLSDFERVLPVVQAVLARWSAESQLVQGPLEWDIIKDAIPANAAELLPYREQVPDIGSPSFYSGTWGANGGLSETDRGLSGWYEHPGPGGSARSGVLWV
ncbi:fungal specific transcription factor domain-containing protein [Stagonosporopsis vannaccii]|nr:fungal specific transcription factor domain-containing protein [Stagonosporopsis vannaccii]